MINKLKIIVLITFLSLLSCKSQQNSTTKSTVPKIDNYTKGELEIKVAPFGLNGNEITVGKVLKDGTIHFNWLEIDLANYENTDFFMLSIKQAVGMHVCHDKQVEKNNESIKVVDTKYLFLYKYGQQVGSLIPATQKEVENSSNNSVLGSTISWVYSDGVGDFKVKCTTNVEWENSYDFIKVTNYNLELKRGWNIVQYTLLEKEDWKNDTDYGSLPKTISKKTIDKIPTNIDWYMKYWANDELIELEHKLFEQKPITKKQFENWLPKKLGDLKRTNYELDKELERMPPTNNINAQFEKNNQKIDVTIVDCANNKDAGNTLTLIKDMASTTWNNKTNDGYRSSSKMDDTPVITEYKTNHKITTLTYTVNDRFIIKAIANNIELEEFWDQLQHLKVEKLSN